MNDLIRMPDHYTHGPIEVIEIIEGFNLDFYEANIIKYLLRKDHKGNETQDLKKAHAYLTRKINLLDGRSENLWETQW